MKELKEKEENLYKQVQNLIKGHQTSLVKSVLDRVNESLLAKSFVK